MTRVYISRILVALASLTFAGIAVAIWLAPGAAGGRLGLDIADAAGRAAIRAEIGGLFLGMSVLCAAAARTLGRGWTLAAVTMLSAIVAGRALGWIDHGIAGDGLAMASEVILLVALLSMLVRAGAGASSPPPRTGGSWRRRSAVIVVVLAVVAAGGAAAITSSGVQQRIVDRAARGLAATVNTAPLADDALRVAVCGSSAPLPSARRAKACVAVFAGGKFYVVDVGPESVENLVLWGLPLSSIGGVLLTHFHSDHIGDLGELNLQTWAGGRPGPLAVYGGPGVEQVVEGFNAAYRLDQGYRTKHHTANVMPPETWPMVARTVTLNGAETTAKDRSTIVLDENGLRITAFEVDHTPIAPAYAYRFDYKGRSALITGDLKLHPALVKAAAGVDLLVSEAIATHITRALGAGAASAGRSRTAAIMHDIEDYHITPEQAARIANDARVGMLVFYHLLPAPDGWLARRVFAKGVGAVRPDNWTIASDGSLYTLPLGTRSVRIGEVSD
jgi:ribonuclease Z